MDTDYINVLEEDLELAQAVCSSISGSDIRNRAVANVLGAKIASRFFEESYQADAETGLHNIAKILEEIDISDIYVKNSYVDVRVYFTEDELCVPKSHFDLGILPIAYMFVKLSPELSGGNVTGFIKPENINKEHLKQDFYYIREDALGSFYDVESSFVTALDTFEIPNELLYEYIEGSLDNNTKIDLLRELIKSKSSRIKLAKAIKAQTVFNSVFISKPESVQETHIDNTMELPDNTNAIEDDLDELYISEEAQTEEELLDALNYTTEITPSNADIIGENGLEQDAAGEQNAHNNDDNIEALFNGEQEGLSNKKKKGSNGFITVLLLLILLIGGCGYFAYTNFGTKQSADISQDSLPDYTGEDIQAESPNPIAQPEAMPVETVEATNTTKNKKEEAAAIAIPAIEKHLDASVLVSNLRVEWEIPAGYANNTSAKHYLFKMGKVIQLNLKTDLLLLSKPPLANKVTVELTFNPNVSKFEVVGIKDSSGEKTVDDVILETVKNALNMHISSNTESFGKLQGKPVLIIRL